MQPKQASVTFDIFLSLKFLILFKNMKFLSKWVELMSELYDPVSQVKPLMIHLVHENIFHHVQGVECKIFSTLS